MSEQMTRVLYLGCALLLLVLAFSAFFSMYRDYQTYVSQVRDCTDSQGLARMEAYAQNDGDMTGHEVVNLILAKRREDKERLLEELYEDPAAPAAFEEYPDIVINGVSYRDVQMDAFEPDAAFQCETVFDANGKPVKMEIRGR